MCVVGGIGGATWPVSWLQYVTVCDTAVRLEKASDQRWSQLKVGAVVGKTDGDDKEDRLRDV